MQKILSGVCIITIFLACTGSVFGADGALVKFHDKTSVKIIPVGTALSVRFPVTYADSVAPGSIKLSVDTITRDAVQDKLYNNLFTLRWDGVMPGVIADIKLDSALEPGSYQFNIRLEGTANNKQLIQLQQLVITVPAATVRSIGKLVINKVVGVTGKAAITGNTLRLQETSRISQLTKVAVTQLDIESANGVVDGSQLVINKLPVDVEPGGIVSLNAALLGRFPLGKTSGKLEVSAPQLVQPYEVAFEVHKSITKLWLIIAIGLGILVGLFVKRNVTLATAISEAQLKAADVLYRLQHPAYPDTTFIQALKEPLRKLQQALDDKDTDEISKQQTEAETVLSKELDKLKTRQKEAQDKLQTLEQTVDGRWKLPKEMQSIIRAAKTRCDEVKTKLEAGNVGAAEDILENLEESTLGSLINDMDGWSDSTRNNIQDLFQEGTPLTFILADLITELKQYETSLAGIKTSQQEATLMSMLKSITNLRIALKISLDDAVKEMTNKLNPVEDKLKEIVDMSDIYSLLKEVHDSRDNSEVENMLEIVVKDNKSLQSVIRDKMLSAADSAIKKDVTVLLGEGKYLEAADKIVSTSQQQKQQGEQGIAPSNLRIQSLVDLQKGTAGDRFRKIASAEIIGSQESRVIIYNIPPVASMQVSTVRSEARKALIKAKCWNSGISLVLAIITGYVIFKDSFIGTPENFAAAFIWAFGVDASIEVIAGVLKKKLAVPAS